MPSLAAAVPATPLRKQQMIAPGASTGHTVVTTITGADLNAGANPTLKEPRRHRAKGPATEQL